MNTPSHAILNLALLLNAHPQAAAPILLGAVLPDVPMFVLYGWAKVRRIPEVQVWRKIYWQPLWQNLTHGFHSIPLAVFAGAIAHLNGWQWAELLCWSTVLHSLGDFPVHHDDAHRHFLPFSHYRFISPFSYWDRRHYGGVVSAIERGLVLVASVWVFPAIDSWIGRGLLIAVNLVYLTGLLYQQFRRSQKTAKLVITSPSCFDCSCEQANQHPTPD